MKYDKFFLALLGASSAHAEASRRIFNDLGLTEAQPKILYILNAYEGSVQKDFAKLCGIKPSTLTVQLTRMEQEGLVRKEACQVSGGKKAYRLYLTEQGKALASSLEERIDKLEEQSFAGFSAEERQTLMQLLEKVEDNLCQGTY